MLTRKSAPIAASKVSSSRDGQAGDPVRPARAPPTGRCRSSPMARALASPPGRRPGPRPGCTDLAGAELPLLDRCEGPHLFCGTVVSHALAHRPRVVEGRGDERDGAGCGGRTHCAAGRSRRRGRPRRSRAGRRRRPDARRGRWSAAQVLQLALPRLRADAVRRRWRRKPRWSNTSVASPPSASLARIVRDDLLFHTGERAGQHDPAHCRRRPGAPARLLPARLAAARCPEDGRDALSRARGNSSGTVSWPAAVVLIVPSRQSRPEPALVGKLVGVVRRWRSCAGADSWRRRVRC